VETKIENGALSVVMDGRSKKFILNVEQITFNGAYAADRGEPVLYVTKRCVFSRGRDAAWQLRLLWR
jgi:propionate CoA-transferase